MEREELLRGSGIGPSSLNSSNSGLSRRDMYLKETAHLHGFVPMLNLFTYCASYLHEIIS